ncbi:phage tail tape measure protein [Brevibacillus sp. NRS-1366]|uniref:phage tail tape measure protein n=1 Tax=Brevibacillus sp. NRS-1366 TaxID=3233899 RepID=UPI003D1BC276
MDKSMAQIQREMKLVASEFDKASAGLKAFGNEEAQLKTKSDQLTKELALQGQKVSLLRQEFQKSAREKGEDSAATQKLATQLNKAEAAMFRMHAELNKVNKELADQPSHMQKWSKELQSVGNRMQSAGMEIATSFGLAGAAVTAALGHAVGTAADFEAKMDRVGAIAEASAADLDAMSESAMKLGAASSKSASEVAEGMEMMAAMGFQANEIIAAMPGVISAAEASGEDMALVADTMAVSLRAFGLEASQSTHVADVLSKTANVSAANLQGMAYALKYAAAPAHTLGMSLEEVSAAVAIMSDAGIRGETAGTTLRMSLTRLAKPTDEASEVLNLLGVKINDTSGNMLPFADIVGQLQQKMSGLSNSQRAAYLATIFGVEAMSGMMTVVEAGPEKFRALTKELENSSGASAEAAAKMKDNLKGALEQLNGALETAQITIGNALIPVIRTLSEAVQGVIEWFNDLSPSMQQVITITAAIAGSLLTLVGAFGAVLAVVGLAASGLGALGPTLGTVAAAILPVTLAIAGLTAAGVLLYKNWDTIKAYAVQVWGKIRDFIQPAVDEVTGYISKKFTELSSWWQEMWPQLKTAFTNVWNGISAVITPIINNIVQLMEWAWPYVSSLISQAWEGIKTTIDISLGLIKGAVEVFAAIFSGDWSRLWEGIKTATSSKLNEIGSSLVTWFTDSVSSIQEKLGEWKKAFTDWFDEQKTTIPAKLTEWWISIAEWFAGIPDKIYGKLLSWGEAIRQWAKEQNQENIRQFSAWWNGISEWFSSVPSKISDSLVEWKNTLVTWFTDQVSSISNSLSGWTTAIAEWFSSIPSKFNSSLNDWWNSISKWFSEIPSKLSAKLDEWWVAIKDWFTGLSSKPEIKNAGTGMITSLADGAKEMSPSAMDELGKNIVDALLGALAVIGIALVAAGREVIKRFVEGAKSIDIAEIGRNIVQGLGEGIQSMAGWIKGKVAEFASWVSSGFKEFFGIASPSRLMADYGKYIVEGLWQGINSMVSWISGKVTEFSSTIAEKIRNFFGINSPSRLMAEYGGYIAEGLAVGMRQNEKAIADAAKAQADIVKKKTQEAKDAAVAHWKEMNTKVKTEADLMATAIEGALTKVQETTSLELAISKQEFELFASTLGTTTADAAQKLDAQMELLKIQLNASTETVDLLKDAYDKMAAAKGENSDEAKKLYLELLKEQTALQGIKNELKEVEAQLKSATAAKIAFRQADGKNYFKNDNGHWVEIGDTGPYNPVIVDDEGNVSEIPGWLNTTKPDTDSGGGGGKKNKYDRDDFTDRDGDFKTPTNDFFDDWHDDLKELEKGSKGIGKAIKDSLDKVKESFRFPGLATGGTVTQSGLTWVGEKGPELLNLPRGSQVVANHDLGKLGSSNVIQNFKFDVRVEGSVNGISDFREQMIRVIKNDALPILTQQLRQPARARG